MGKLPLILFNKRVNRVLQGEMFSKNQRNH